jgi:hypothetical protein
LAESQSRTFADAFGREERLEHAIERLLLHAVAGVRHCKHHILAGGHWLDQCPDIILVQPHVGGLDCKLATFRHGVARIYRNVKERTFDFRPVSLG